MDPGRRRPSDNRVPRSRTSVGSATRIGAGCPCSPRQTGSPAGRPRPGTTGTRKSRHHGEVHLATRRARDAGSVVVSHHRGIYRGRRTRADDFNRLDLPEGNDARLVARPDHLRTNQYRRPLLPFCIASLVELRVRPLRRRRPISLSSTRGAATSLAAELLRSGRRWRLTSTAAAGDGSTTEHLVEVIDAGPDGYWEITRDTGEGGLVLTARSTDSVLRMIGDVTVRP